MLQVDPSQKKAVVALLVVLVGAVAFLLVRLLPGSRAPQASAQAAQPAAKTTPACAVGEVRVGPARNPFHRPDGAAPLACVAEDPDSLVQLTANGRTEGVAESFDVRPMPVPTFGAIEQPGSGDAARPARAKTGKPDPRLLAGMVLGGTGNPAEPNEAEQHSKDEAPRPSFKLLATIKSGGVYSAVLRVGDAQTRVVEVGDIIDGRFKVARIQENLAVLLDGRDVIIATRPRS